MTRSPRYALPAHLCRFWYGRPGPSLEVFLGSMGSTASPKRLRLASRARGRADFHALRPTRFHGDVQNPARLPSSVAPSVITVPRRCRNVRLLRIGYACRPRLSSRLTLGGLAFPRNPWAHGGSVSHAALATHASILTSERSTAGRPAASPPSESSPTTELVQSAASAPCLAPCIVGACPLDQ